MEDFQDTEGKIIGRVSDIFRGNRDVKMYAIEDKMSATFFESADVLRRKVFDRDVKDPPRQHAAGSRGNLLLRAGAAWWRRGRYMNGHLNGGRVLLVFSARSARAPGSGAAHVPVAEWATAGRRRASTGSTMC